MRRVGAWGGLLAAALALPVAGCSGGSEARRIVFVTFDTTRADRFGCYGSDRGLTPNVDSLAGEGTVFEHAVSPVPTTLPSHSTMFTGLYPHDHGVRYNLMYLLGESADTLAERLQQAGYATAAFPATFIVAKRFGLDQGFDHWVEPPTPGDESKGAEESVMRRAAEGVDLAIDWLEGQGSAKTFVWLHFYDPHGPYRPPFPYSAQHKVPYDGEIAYTDGQFGRLMDWLRERPEWDDTAVIVVGDHGEGLYDHNERFHSYLVYESTQHVPLVIRAPGRGAGRVAEPVTLADLMPTALELAGVDPPEGLRGVSLVSALGGGGAPRREIYFESHAGALNFGWAELEGIRSGSWKLIQSPDPQLFDLAADPGETNNLATFEAVRLAEMQEALAQIARSAEDDAAAEDAVEDALDPETDALLNSLGYLAGGAGGSAENPPLPQDLIDLEPELMEARIHIATQRWNRLEETCRYVLQRNPTNKWALKNIALAMVRQGRPAEAEVHAATFMDTYRDADEGYQLLARTLEAQGKTVEAFETLELGMRRTRGTEALRYLLLTAGLELGRESTCEATLAEALEAHPESSRMRVAAARCAARQGSPEEALAELERAVEYGFREFELIHATGEFAEVVALPGFAELQAEAEAEAPAENAGT